MSNAVKHKQRSHYSYRNNNAAVFSGFESRATRKNVQQKSLLQRLYTL